jgi:hypothetical protein
MSAQGSLSVWVVRQTKRGTDYVHNGYMWLTLSFSRCVLGEDVCRLIEESLAEELAPFPREVKVIFDISRMTPQSRRSLQAWADSRGPGENLSEGMRRVLAALDDGCTVSATFYASPPSSDPDPSLPPPNTCDRCGSTLPDHDHSCPKFINPLSQLTRETCDRCGFVLPNHYRLCPARFGEEFDDVR